MHASSMRLPVPMLSLLLLLNSVTCQPLFKCVTVFECSDRPCELVKESVAVQAIDNRFLKDLYEEIKVQASTERIVLYRGAVKNLNNLERLKLGNMKIVAIEPGAFQNLPNLEVLDLHKNFLEQITEGVFNVLNATEIYLQANRIETIASGAFDNMMYLEILNLDNNRLKAVHPDWFFNSPNVQYISLKQNRIEALPELAFKNVKGQHIADDGDIVKTDIYLSKNKITSIHPRAFTNLNTIGDLYLNNNRLHSLSNNTFGSIKQIDFLVLSKNKLHSLENGIFTTTSLIIEELDLTFNKFECLSYEMVSRVNRTLLFGNKNLDCVCLNRLKRKLVQDGKNSAVRFEKRNCKKKKMAKKKLLKKAKKKKKLKKEKRKKKGV